MSAQSDAITKLVAMVANSSTLQNRTGFDETEVLERIHTAGQVFDPWLAESPVFPSVSIWVPEGGFPAYTSQAEGSAHQYSTLGVLRCVVFDNERYPGDPNRGYEDAAEFLAAVFEDILDLSNVDDNLVIIGADSAPPFEPALLRDDIPDGQRYQALGYDLQWMGHHGVGA